MAESGHIADKTADKVDDIEPSIMTLADIITNIRSSNAQAVLTATQSVRKLLSKKKPPIDRAIEFGLVDKLVKALDCNDKPSLQLEAAQALAIIASYIFEKIYFVGNKQWSEQQSTMTMDERVTRVTDIRSRLHSLAVFNATKYVTKFMCKELPLPPSDRLNTAGQVDKLVKFLNFNDKKPNLQLEPAQALTATNLSVVQRLVEVLGSVDGDVISAITNVGNIYIDCVQEIQAVIVGSVMPLMPGLLQQKDQSTKQAACGLLCNLIYMGKPTVTYIQSVIDHNVIPSVVKVLCTGDELSKKEAALVFIAINASGTFEQIMYALECGALKPLCDFLAQDCPTSFDVFILDVVYNILKKSAKVGEVEDTLSMLKEAGALKKIKKLQDVDKRAYDIVDEFLCEEGEDEDVTSQSCSESSDASP